MRIESLAFSGFRNLKDGKIELSSGVNILYGDNAQGKTNVLEACWIFTGGKSFRGAKDSELITFHREKANLSARFFAGERTQTADIEIVKRRSLTLNGVKQKSPTAITGRFCAVVFCPAHLNLVSGAPEERRRFIDSAYCQLRPAYIKILAEYQKILTQRNALLKMLKSGEGDKNTVLGQLSVWDEALATAAAKVTFARLKYIKKMLPECAAVYNGLSGGKEQLEIALQTAVIPSESVFELYEQYRLKIAEARPQDIAAGFSTVGAHREDLLITLDGISAKDFGSQGQKRSCVLALKLAEATLLKEVTGEQPIALLDDVMSELDISRQDYILNHIHDWQVLITCCDHVAIERQTGGKVFHIQNGEIL